MTSWKISVDWDRKGIFTEVTDYVVSANWFLGFRRPYQEIADDSVLELVLDNSDRRFSPEYSSSPLVGKLVPFRPVRVQSNDGTLRTHWIGWIERIEPTVSLTGKRTVKITAAGPMMFLKAVETSLPLQENQRADEIIEQLLTEVVFPAGMTGVWVLGKVGNSELGTNTWLPDPTLYLALDTGITTFAVAGDNWVIQGEASDSRRNGFDVYRAIFDLTAAERGRFLFSRAGQAVFWNRHHLVDEASTAATFDDTMIDLMYTYAGQEELKNEVIVVCHPRTIGASVNDILWQLTDKITVSPGKSREISVRYQDESNNRIGGRNVSVTDVVFSKGSASVTLKAGANSGTITVTNTGTKNAVLTSCMVRGQKVTDFGQMEAHAIDGLSIADYGRRTLKMNLPAVDNFEDAQAIADFEKSRRSIPRGAVTAVTLKSHGLEGSAVSNPLNYAHSKQLALSLGDRLVIKEGQTYHGKTADYASKASYYIIGEAHKLTAGATLFETTWYLEPTPTSYTWKLGIAGRSELGQVTSLTY